MAKDLLSRLAIDNRKIGPAHSGSPLMNPRSPAQLASTRGFTWPITVLAVGGVHGPCLFTDATVIQVDCGAVGGTATFNIEIRTAYDVSGTNVFGSDVTADGTAQHLTAFSAPVGLASNWFYLNITAFDVGTTELTVTVNVQ